MENHLFLSKYGSPKHLDKLSTSDDYKHRSAIAASHPEYHEKLSLDKHATVRKAVAHSTKDKSIHDRLMHDHDHEVRANVAKHGYPDHMDHFVKDSDWYVRTLVAKKTNNEEHLNTLMHDHDESVRGAVADQGHKPNLDHLVHDKSSQVRQSVASHGYHDHHEILKNDPSHAVRAIIARQTSSIPVLQHMVKHEPDTNLRSNAQDNLDYHISAGRK